MASTVLPLEYDVVPTLPLVRAHLVINCVLVFVAWSVVALRVMARKWSGAGLGWDDYLIVAALGLGMLIMQGMYSQLGVGYPLTEVPQNLYMILRILIGYVLVFAVSTLTIKLSVLFFYLRIFTNRAMKRASMIVMIWVSCWSVGNILQVFLICQPFEKSYNPNITYGTCGSQKASFIAIGAFNAVTDVAILILPIQTIWSLQTKLATKISLLAVFLVGVATTIVSVIRIISMNNLDLTTNLTGTMVYADFLSAFEVNLGILCVSLPTMGPIYRRVFRRGAGTSRRTGGGTSGAKGGGAGGLGTGSSSNALRTFGTGGRKQHYRLDDDKASMYYAGTRIQAGGGDGGSPASSDVELNAMLHGQHGPNAIQVETEWVVQVSDKK